MKKELENEEKIRKETKTKRKNKAKNERKSDRIKYKPSKQQSGTQTLKEKK